jgi:hypothetical protein
MGRGGTPSIPEANMLEIRDAQSSPTGKSTWPNGPRARPIAARHDHQQICLQLLQRPGKTSGRRRACLSPPARRPDAPPMRHAIRPRDLRPLLPYMSLDLPNSSRASKQSQPALLPYYSFRHYGLLLCPSTSSLLLRPLPPPAAGHAQCYPTSPADLHNIHASRWCRHTRLTTEWHSREGGASARREAIKIKGIGLTRLFARGYTR